MKIPRKKPLIASLILHFIWQVIYSLSTGTESPGVFIINLLIILLIFGLGPTMAFAFLLEAIKDWKRFHFIAYVPAWVLMIFLLSRMAISMEQWHIWFLPVFFAITSIMLLRNFRKFRTQLEVAKAK